MNWSRTISKDLARVASAMMDRRNTMQMNRCRLARWLRVVVMCCCAGIGGLAHGEHAYAPAGTVPGAENQLRQLKQALMTLAMDQKAHIAASGWTDPDGALTEDLLVFSGLEVEKLRPIVRRNRFGVETTELVYAAATPDKTCGTSPARQQRLGLTVTIHRHSQADDDNMARAAATLLQQHMHAEVAQNSMTNVAALLTSQPKQSSGMSTYLRYMTAVPESSQDLNLELRVRTTDRKPLLHRYGLLQRARSSKSLQVQLRLVAQGAVVLALQTGVLLPSNRQSAMDQLAWLELPQATQQRLVDWLDAALPDVARAVNCHGESGLAIAANANEITLLGGRDAGVYQGQRMAILPNSRRLRTRGLEQSLSVVGVAEVTRVGPRSATLTMYAGPGQSDIADMMALPMAAFAP